MNRRSFISSLAVAGVAAATPSSRLFSAEAKGRPKVGLGGCGSHAGDTEATHHLAGTYCSLWIHLDPATV